MATTPASVSALLKPKADLGRNAFPLDHRQVYSIKAGQITPVKCMKFVPGDHHSIDVGEFCITFPMQTAPFLRGRKETVFYSVYNSAVWSLFNQYIGQRSDPKTSALNTNLSEPRIALWDLYRLCLSQFIYYVNYKYGIEASNRHEHPSYSEEAIVKSIDEDRQDFLTDEFSINDVWGSAHTFHVDWSHFNVGVGINTTLNFASTNVNPNVSTPENADYCQDIVGQFRVYNYIRKLDMLGYGNLVPWFRECENFISDLINDSSFDWSSDEDYADLVGTINSALETLAQKLIDSTMTFSAYDTERPTIPARDATPIYVYKNLYAICAYNLIFYHFFRNSFYDLNYNPKDYNLDFSSVYLESGNRVNVISIIEFSLRFLDIEYHQWKKDQFTGVLPDTQFGAVSSLNITGVTGSDFNRWVKNSGNVSDFDKGNISLFQVSTNNVHGYNSVDGYVGDAIHSHEVSASFDMIALKRAEILQDYRQTMMRAGNKTSDIFKALYGGAPSSEHLDDIIPRFIETFGEDVFVDPVTATANTEQGNNGTLGDLSARGKFSGSSKKFSFNAGNNFGVLMCLTYFVPSSEYNSYFLDPANGCLNPEDHYIPNFENMGLEPIYSDELNSLRSRRELSVLGYAPRYHYLKSQVDVVHGEFVSLPANEKLFTPQTGQLFSRSIRFKDFQGMFNIWVSPRSDMQNRRTTQLRDFYINPSILDNIFVQSTDATQGSDTLICNTYLNWQATRAMSKVGLMNFV